MANLRTISANLEYRTWNDKLVNALATVIPRSREVMDYIRQKVDSGVTFIEESEYESQSFASERSWASCSGDPYSILIDKA